VGTGPVRRAPRFLLERDIEPLLLEQVAPGAREPQLTLRGRPSPCSRRCPRGVDAHRREWPGGLEPILKVRRLSSQGPPSSGSPGSRPNAGCVGLWRVVRNSVAEALYSAYSGCGASHVCDQSPRAVQSTQHTSTTPIEITCRESTVPGRVPARSPLASPPQRLRLPNPLTPI
jgi:hypothetical protein